MCSSSGVSRQTLPKFRQALTERADEFETIVAGAGARAQGAVHHRFGIGDGFVMIVDEWQSFEQFQQFFSNPDLHAFIESVGASPGPPDLIVAEASTSPDQF